MASHYKGCTNNSGSILEYWPDYGVYTIKAKALDIVWGADRRYWRLNDDGSAELIQVCWLEVTGSFPMSSLRPGRYVLQFDVQMRADAFGWSSCPIRIMLKPGAQARSIVEVVELTERSTRIPKDGVKFEISGTTGKVMFGMFEIWREKWKGGMIINKLIIQKLT